MSAQLRSFGSKWSILGAEGWVVRSAARRVVVDVARRGEGCSCSEALFDEGSRRPEVVPNKAIAVFGAPGGIVSWRCRSRISPLVSFPQLIPRQAVRVSRCFDQTRALGQESRGSARRDGRTLHRHRRSALAGLRGRSRGARKCAIFCTSRPSLPLRHGLGIWGFGVALRVLSNPPHLPIVGRLQARDRI
jgi:hypothetical protein